MASKQDPTTSILLRSEETEGHVSVTEIVVPPHNAGPPLHTHDFDEAFYLLEGELIFQVEEALMTKGAGELSFRPAQRSPRAGQSQQRARALPVDCTPGASSVTGRASPPRRPGRAAAVGAAADPRSRGRRPADRGAGVRPPLDTLILELEAVASGEPRSRPRIGQSHKRRPCSKR